MVTTLIKLKWKLLINLITRSISSAIGTIIGVLYALAWLSVLVMGCLWLGLENTDTNMIAAVTVLAGAVTILGWSLVPLLITGVDSTLDPRAMAAWIAPSRSLARALAIANMCGITGIATGIGLLLPGLAWLLAGHWVTGIFAWLLAPVALATCVVLSRVVVIGAGLSQSRRGREIVYVIVVLVVFAISMAPSLSNLINFNSSTHLYSAFLTTTKVIGFIPLGWVFAAPAYLAQGQWLLALILALASLVFAYVLMQLWTRVVARVMTVPERGKSHAQAYSKTASAESKAQLSVDPLPWQRRLNKLISSPASAVAARSLRYWRRDPRYLAQFSALLFLPVIIVVGIISGFHAAGSDGAAKTLNLAWGHAPAWFMGIVVVIALLCGWALQNDIAVDSTAFWQHVSAGIRGKDDLLGRIVAACLWQVPLILLLLGLAAAYSGRGDVFPAALGLCAAFLGCAYAWSCFSCVLMPYETNAPGDSPLRSHSSGKNFLASLVQCLGILVIVLVTLPIWGLFIVIAVNHSWAWGWLLALGGIIWALAAAWIGIAGAGRLLEKRGAVVLSIIRSWPRHEEIR